jgi:hypothetical protein
VHRLDSIRQTHSSDLGVRFMHAFDLLLKDVCDLVLGDTSTMPSVAPLVAFSLARSADGGSCGSGAARDTRAGHRVPAQRPSLSRLASGYVAEPGDGITAGLNHNRTVVAFVEVARMRRLWRPLVLAAVLSVIVGPAVARAQTVIVRNAPAGAPLEVTLNATVAGKATADQAGDGRIATSLFPGREVSEIVVHLAVDACGELRRIVLAERTMVVPAPGVGCDRRDVSGPSSCAGSPRS